MRATTSKASATKRAARARKAATKALINPFASNPAQIALLAAQSSHQDAAAEMVGLWGDAARMWMDAGTTIGWRMPFLMRLDASHPEVERERNQMVAEKMQALAQTGFSAMSAATVFATAMARGPSMAGATEAAARAMRSTMKPSAVKAKANAKRLTARALNNTKV
jgi:hypothetical protein